MLGSRAAYSFNRQQKPSIKSTIRGGIKVVSGNAVIKNATGLHLKPAARFCEEALKYKSTITFTFGGTTANAKSVLSVLGACVKSGDEIEIVCNGEDEQEALDNLLKAISEGLGDEI